MAIKIPIITEYNNSGLSDADRALERFGVTSKKELQKAAAGFAVLGAVGMKAFSSLDAGYDAITTGTGATGDALAGLKKDAESVARTVPNSFADVGAAIAEVNTRLGLTGAPLQAMTKQFLDLARLTGGDVKQSIGDVTRVFGDWGVSVEDQARTMDLLFAATQQTGIGIDRLSQLTVQFGAPLRQMGFELEEAVAIFGKFEKEGVNIETVMSGLRQGLGRMAKAGEEPVATFKRLVDEIANAGSTGEANAIALEAFGQRAGPDMAAAIREGRFEIDELVAALGNSDGALETASEAAMSANDRLKVLGNQLMVAAIPAVETFAAVADSMIGVLTALPQPVQAIVIGLAALAIALKSTRSALAAFGVTSSTVSVSSMAMRSALVAGGAAMAAYAIHSAQAATRQREFADSIRELGRAADEALVGQLANALAAGVMAGRSFEATLSDIAEQSPGTISRIIELEDATGELTQTMMSNGRSAADAAVFVDRLRDSFAAEQVAIAAAEATHQATNAAIAEATGVTDDLTGSVDDNTSSLKANTKAQSEKKTALDRVRQSTEDLTLAQVGLLGSEIGIEQASYRFQDAQAELQSQIDQGNTPGTRAYDEALTNAKSAALNMAQASADQEIAVREANNETVSADQKARILEEKLNDLAHFSIPAVSDALETYRARLAAIPRNVITRVQIEETTRRIVQSGVLGPSVTEAMDGRSHVGSMFGAGESKMVVPGQVFTPSVPGRMSSVEESARMLAGGVDGQGAGAPLQVVLSFDGANFFGAPSGEFVQVLAGSIDRLKAGMG